MDDWTVEKRCTNDCIAGLSQCFHVIGSDKPDEVSQNERRRNITSAGKTTEKRTSVCGRLEQDFQGIRRLVVQNTGYKIHYRAVAGDDNHTSAPR